MDKEKAKKWLDVISGACNTLINNNGLMDGMTYSISGIREMHLFVSAEELMQIADAVGATIGLLERYTIEYPYQYYFIYNGIKFLCLSKKRLEESEEF